MAEIILAPLAEGERNQFILDNQEAFRYGAMEEFGLRDGHFEADRDKGDDWDGMFRFEKVMRSV